MPTERRTVGICFFVWKISLHCIIIHGNQFLQFLQTPWPPEDGEPKGREQGRGLQGRGFSAETSNQISLMKWAKIVKPTGAEMKGIRVLHFLKLPSVAISPWVFDHFISEMTDCT